jgi:mRNA interferase HigB
MTKNLAITLCKFQGCARWCAVGRFTLDFLCPSDRKSPNEVKQTYGNASILKDGRIVFNIKGNSYRLVAKFNFEKQWVFIRFIGTHEEYDRIDANTI